MTTVTSKNLLEFIIEYFKSLGLENEARCYFTAKNFVEGLILKLPAVCLVPANKPENSRSKQTHIHVTGNNRYFFYDKTDVDSASNSTDDIKQYVLVSRQNINALNDRALMDGGLYFHPSHVMKKIACRATQEAQVQLSKLRMDGELFIELRNSLYENDLLVFLRHRDNEAMAVVGIPLNFYENNYMFDADFYSGLESKGTVTVKSALVSVMDEYDDSDIVDGNEAISDAIYQERVNAAPAISTDFEPIVYEVPEKERVTKNFRPMTNPSLGKEAIRLNNCCCAVNKYHPTFIKKNGEKYMEVHHLIPLERQRDFVNKLDTRANLVPLCPLCHKLLHYGRIEDVMPIITKLRFERANDLKDSGIEITIEKLLEYYV